MRSGPAHDAHRLAVIEACEQAGVVIYRSRLGFRLVGDRLDIEVSDLIHIQPTEIIAHKPRERIPTLKSLGRPRSFFRHR